MTALLLDKTPAAGMPPPARRRAGGGLWTAVRSSPKALVGLAIFAVFLVFAAAPELFTSVRHPNDIAFTPTLGPSGAH